MEQVKCFACQKTAYIVERVYVLNRYYHKACLKCTKCQKILTIGRYSDHCGELYCEKPCYTMLFGPEGYGRKGSSGIFQKQE